MYCTFDSQDLVFIHKLSINAQLPYCKVLFLCGEYFCGAQQLCGKEDRIFENSCIVGMWIPVWKVCIVRGRNPLYTFDAFYIFTIKFSKSPLRNFQTFQSGVDMSVHITKTCESAFYINLKFQHAPPPRPTPGIYTF
jgi:hypothetical protein